ncbi:hypothetical protein KR49_00450 [Synechococcus sp. KORDI-49]|nr:hypothetical protein KR49_00450 [Synechococcus sp. KORDI-49]
MDVGDASIFGDIRCERDRQCHENRDDNGATLAAYSLTTADYLQQEEETL